MQALFFSFLILLFPFKLSLLRIVLPCAFGYVISVFSAEFQFAVLIIFAIASVALSLFHFRFTLQRSLGIKLPQDVALKFLNIEALQFTHLLFLRFGIFVHYFVGFIVHYHRFGRFFRLIRFIVHHAL